MSEPRPSFFSRILKSGYSLDFFGLFFEQINSNDHCPEIKFQRIWPNTEALLVRWRFVRKTSYLLNSMAVQ